MNLSINISIIEGYALFKYLAGFEIIKTFIFLNNHHDNYPIYVHVIIILADS